MKSVWKILFVTALTALACDGGAYNLSQLSSREGLSNSAILSLCQDSRRFMWIGTADGLNLYNGADISVFKPGVGNALQGTLSGNLIEEVWEGEEGIIWINTNHGLNRYDKSTRKTVFFNEFEGKYYCASTATHEFFVIRENGVIHYFDRPAMRFVPIALPEIIINDIQRIFIDAGDVLYLVTNKGVILTAQLLFNDNTLPQFAAVSHFTHDRPIRHAFIEKESVYFIDYDGSLYDFRTITGRKTYISNLKREVDERGVVSSVIRDGDDYLVGFQTNGLLRLQYTPENEKRYRTSSIDIRCGVFCLLRDEQQDIIWIGTDGQGLYLYTRDRFSFRSVTFENLRFAIQKPVRAMFLDRNQDLWTGTKDDGILLIRGYHPDEDIDDKEIIHLTASNSQLINNSVYAFGASSRNLLWIGGDGPGLNYWSFKERRMKRLPSRASEAIVFVHHICEVNDTTLWLASVGAGIYKVTLGGTGDEPYIRAVKRFSFIRDEMSYNFFFTACRQNDSILWFGNRGYGLQRLNINTEHFDNVLFPQQEARTINDILSLYPDSGGNLWAGTSFGIVKISDYNPATHKTEYINYNEIEGLPNNTIHGIEQDRQGFLWLSTNGGLVRFAPESGKFQLFNARNGLKVFEFSDGAQFCRQSDGTLLFGGINGFVSIAPDTHEPQEYVPQIFFTDLRIHEQRFNINDFLRAGKGGGLRLKHNQNFFSITFIAPDYINGQNCKYSYNIENFNDVWIENGRSNTVSLTNLPPGAYRLNVRCDNGTVMTDVYSLAITVLPPWYKSVWAYVLYAMLLIAAMWLIIRTVRLRYRRKRENIIEEMNRRQKEEIYESKLRFFTNITHEFSTPLTLIYGPCERLLGYANADGFVRKYAGMIMKNTQRLYALIQELIEFRRIETGHRELVYERLDVSQTIGDIVESFTELAENKAVEFRADIEENVFWNTDKGCFTKILSNLLSNAFKYTPEGGRISVEAGRQDDYRLRIAVSNTGKGIREKDIPYVFDRYRVLENLERQSNKGFFSRNGLGLAICHNMVKLLDGEIEVRSEVNQLTEFEVVLPWKALPETDGDRHCERSEAIASWINLNKVPNLVKVEAEDKPNRSLRPVRFCEPVKGGEEDCFVPRNDERPTVFVIDDDAEMRYFLTDILSAKYNAVAIEKPLTVRGMLETQQPELIISDIMMPDLDGITLMKQIKADARTAGIPFILLSAKNTPEEQTEGVNAGADAYISKPFNVNYLLSVAERVMQRQKDLQQYYNSPVSAFEYVEGKYIHREHKAFYDKVLRTIDAHFSNPDFSAERLAKELGLSPRHLYRRLQEITEHSPAELIRSYRLQSAEKMLTGTKKSIDEIMYATGFNNRGNFYRLFASVYGVSPQQYRTDKLYNIK